MARLIGFILTTVLWITTAWATPLYYIYTMGDGGVAVMNAQTKERLAADLGLDPKKWSDEDYKAFVLQDSLPPDATNVKEMPQGWAPPPDRTFRNAWKQRPDMSKGNFEVGIDVDMPKARELMKEKIARAVVAKGKSDADKAALDAAMGQPEATPAPDEITVPVDAIDAAQTPEELKATWPTALATPESAAVTK